MGKMLGVMIDCSRNAVMKPDKVKEFAAIIRKMGYNTLMLYTEDTYEIDSQPFFGYMRGKYLKSELSDIDEYCRSIGIELIPCIQTLAHLNGMFKWKDAYRSINDIDDILLAGSEKTYELIDDMFRNLSGCISSRKIHIGMDEAYMIGLGKYRELHGIKDRFEIICAHLKKVCDIAARYGYETMIWNDMFIKLATGVADFRNKSVDTDKIRTRTALPENVSMVYWDYYTKEASKYAELMRVSRAFGRKVYFAGGAWAWKGFAPNNRFSIKTTDIAFTGFEDAPSDGDFITIWGDNGAECSPFTVLPALMYFAKRQKGKVNMPDIKIEFKEITGADFDSFITLDLIDMMNGDFDNGVSLKSSKKLFYNDPFLGLIDAYCEHSDNEYYKELACKISEAAEKAGKFKYEFTHYIKFCEVLAKKCDIGIRTRKIYKSGDKEAIKKLAKEYEEIAKKIADFHDAFEARWFENAKPYGFEVQDIRIGGLKERFISCGRRLLSYAEGRTESIPELEENILDTNILSNYWSGIVTANNI